MTQALFHERQQFRQAWLWIVLLAVSLPLAVLLGFGLYQQIGLGKPFGDNPMSDAGLIAFTSAMLLLLVGIFLLFRYAVLDVEVTREEVRIFFRPFHLRPRHIPIASIAEAQRRRYSPLSEYGGWGIRLGPSGWAYNVSGDEGVQLVLGDGKRILIGSQRSGELEEAIRTAKA